MRHTGQRIIGNELQIELRVATDGKGLDVRGQRIATLTNAIPQKPAALGRVLAADVQTKPRLGMSGALTGNQLFVKINSALAEIGIAANVVAGLHHDHLFVPADRSAAALAALRSLSTDAG